MRTAVVTGASQGIGAAIALALAAEAQTRVALVSRRPEALEEVAARCREMGAEAQTFACDVTKDAQVAQMAAEVTALWGAPDVLVNNVGRFTPSAFSPEGAADFRAQIDTNLTSAYLVTSAFLQGMLARASGTIFFLGSVASIKAYPGSVAYCAAKHGLLGMARVLREETRQKGLRVTTLLPGATLTPNWDGVDIPEERFVPAEDIAQAVVDVLKLSGRTVVEELLIRPQEGDI